MTKLNIKWKPSNYKFTHPIRFFKQNDPYLYTVDNTPLTELQNNDLFLKDQLENLQIEIDGIDRTGFTELQPYVAGTDNIVRVKPGKYTGRVNDAYNKSPLEKLAMVFGTNIGELEKYSKSGLSPNEILEKYISTSLLDVVNANGLLELAQLHSIKNEDSAYSVSSPSYAGFGVDVHRLQAFPGKHSYSNTIGLTISNPLNWRTVSYYSNKFIRRWSGVFRTSVVDVPEELTIEIPKFDEEDYNYISGTTEITPDTATQRIDLIFVYTHPIDASSTTVAEYTGSNPRTITKAELGLVRGAGIGLIVPDTSGETTNGPLQGGYDADGNRMILASIADSLAGAPNGFSGLDIHGSFPSPDDLMNLAPLLLTDLEDTDLQLVGQSILPLCYVVVNKTASTTAGGNPILTTANIIDIRPFFRTTELTYNERAGIGAAVPQLSFANPAVGQVQLDEKEKKVIDYVNSRTQSIIEPKVLAAGSILGGVQAGPEGAIIRQYPGITAATQFTNSVDIRGYYPGFTAEMSIPRWPQWDPADWGAFVPVEHTIPFGWHRNDWLNGSLYGHITEVKPGYTYDTTTDILKLGGYDSRESEHFFVYVKKKIEFTNLPQWAKRSSGGTYTVDAQLLNCVLRTNVGSDDDNDTQSNYGGIWVERFDTYFVIFVAWAMTARRGGLWLDYTNEAHRASYDFATVGAFLENDRFKNTSVGRSYLAPCTYPSVTWKLTAYPSTSWKTGDQSTINLGG